MTRHTDTEIEQAAQRFEQVADSVEATLHRRARQHGEVTGQEAREILRNAAQGDGCAPARLGARIAARFAGIGLHSEIPEQRGHPACPARLEP